MSAGTHMNHNYHVNTYGASLFILYSQTPLFYFHCLDNILTAMFPVSRFFFTSCLSEVCVEKPAKILSAISSTKQETPTDIKFQACSCQFCGNVVLQYSECDK